MAKAEFLFVRVDTTVIISSYCSPRIGFIGEFNLHKAAGAAKKAIFEQ